MFTAEYESGGSALSKIVDLVKDNISEGVLVINDKGIALQSLDDLHVAMVEIVIDKAAATSYRCSEEYQLGVSFATLSKIFKCSSSSGTCTLTFDPAKSGDVLKIVFKGKKTARFSVKLLDLDFSLRQMPEDIVYSATQTLSSRDLGQVIKDLSGFAEVLSITRKGASLVFAAEGDSADANVEMLVEDDENSMDSEEIDISAKYDIKFLVWFTKAASISDELYLAFDTRYPMLMQFKDENRDVRFFLASKIQD